MNTYILGAGFSMTAKYPSGNALNQTFFKNVENRLLRQSAGEWQWDDYDAATSNNGRLNYDHINISYLLSELIEAFQREQYTPFDYEEFYDWLTLGNTEKKIPHICKNVNQRLKKDNYHSAHSFKNPGRNEYSTILECYQYLIADLLHRPYEREDKYSLYMPFIKDILAHQKTHIYSLNHDLLIEYLFARSGIAYSDGFSDFETNIADNQGNELSVFKNKYEKETRLYKLHGSVDYYQFSEMNNTNGIYYDTENKWIFKTLNYLSKHGATLINPATKDVLQHFNYPGGIIPQFLTGKKKIDLIPKHFFYKNLYESFIESLTTTERIVIIGYSYRDVHVNQLIKDCIDKRECTIVNINPDVTFPFRRSFSDRNIINLKNLIQFSPLIFA